ERLVHLVDVEVAVEDAGVVHHDLERTQRRDRRPDRRIELGGLARVGAMSVRAASGRLDRARSPACGSLVDVDRADREAVGREPPRDRLPEPRAGAGHHRNTFGVRHVRLPCVPQRPATAGTVPVECYRASCCRYLWTKAIAMLPSPTAEATRFTGLNLTSPQAKTPGTLDSRR